MNKIRIVHTLVFLSVVFSSQNPSAQFSHEKRDSIASLTKKDHQLMLEKLGIESLRPGPSGNPEDDNAANSDESMVNKITDLPDPLVFNNGQKVENKQGLGTAKKRDL